MKNLLRLKLNERGALVLCFPNGEQLPGINGIKVEQDLHMMKAGVAQVKISLLVKVEKPESNG